MFTLRREKVCRDTVDRSAFVTRRTASRGLGNIEDA
jgi:hypothetical protein